MKGIKYVLYLSLCAVCLLGCTSENELESRQEEYVEPVKTEERLTMSFTGDLLFEQGLYDSWNDYDFGTYFDQIKPFLDTDLTIGNQEVPIGGEALGISGTAFTFNAPEKIADQLPSVGFDIMTLSNNHSYDKGYQGVVNTLESLHKNNIETVGLYASKEDADEIQIVEKNGIKVALLAYTYDTNEMIEPEHDYVVKTFLNENHEFDKEHKAMIRQEVEDAKAQADVVIASMHWGTEFSYTINTAQIDATNFLNELGVDLIIGNHPHCLQTMETLTHETNGNQTIVFYSLGNFVSAAAMVDRASIDFANMYEIGGIVNLTIVKDLASNSISIEDLSLTPIVNQFEHGYTNFSLIPWKNYNEELAQKHYQREFSENFNYEWLKEQIHHLFEGKITINE